MGQPEQDGQAAEPERGGERRPPSRVVVGMRRELLLGDVPGLAEEVGRGAVRGQPLGVFGGVEQRFDGLGAVVAPREVMRDQGARLGALLAGARLE